MVNVILVVSKGKYVKQKIHPHKLMEFVMEATNITDHMKVLSRILFANKETKLHALFQEDRSIVDHILQETKTQQADINRSVNWTDRLDEYEITSTKSTPSIPVEKHGHLVLFSQKMTSQGWIPTNTSLEDAKKALEWTSYLEEHQKTKSTHSL